MTTPRDNIEAKLGLTGPPLQTMRDAPPHIPDHELIRRIGQGAYGEVWLARNALGTWRAVKIVYRDNFKDARPYEREFAGIRRFEPISRSSEGFVDILHVGRFDSPETDQPERRAGGTRRRDELRELPISHPIRWDELRESPSPQPKARGGWFYYVMELADSGERPKEECRKRMHRQAALPLLPSAFLLLTSPAPSRATCTTAVVSRSKTASNSASRSPSPSATSTGTA